MKIDSNALPLCTVCICVSMPSIKRWFVVDLVVWCITWRKRCVTELKKINFTFIWYAFFLSVFSFPFVYLTTFTANAVATRRRVSFIRYIFFYWEFVESVRINRLNTKRSIPLFNQAKRILQLNAFHVIYETFFKTLCLHFRSIHLFERSSETVIVLVTFRLWLAISMRHMLEKCANTKFSAIRKKLPRVIWSMKGEMSRLMVLFHKSHSSMNVFRFAISLQQSQRRLFSGRAV